MGFLHFYLLLFQFLFCFVLMISLCWMVKIFMHFGLDPLLGTVFWFDMTWGVLFQSFDRHWIMIEWLSGEWSDFPSVAVQGFIEWILFCLLNWTKVNIISLTKYIWNKKSFNVQHLYTDLTLMIYDCLQCSCKSVILIKYMQWFLCKYWRWFSAFNFSAYFFLCCWFEILQNHSLQVIVHPHGM